MANITKDSENIFINFLKSLNNLNCNNLLAIRYGLSKYINREALVTDTDSIAGKLKYYKDMSEKVFREVSEQMKPFPNTTVYMFADNDIVIVTKIEDQKNLEEIQECYKKITPCFPTGMAEFIVMKDNLSYCKSIAMERLANVDVIAAYHELACPTTKDSHTAIRKERGRPLVLIADSDMVSAERIKKMISKDYIVSIANSGPNAIRKYIKEAPDCVILDLAVPNLSGMEVSLSIKSFDIDAFIIMMSTDPIQQSIIDSFNSGAGDFIKKPVIQARILDAIKKSPYISGPKQVSLEEMQSAEEVFVF